MSEIVNGDLDRRAWNHCYECGARAEVERYDTYYKLVECGKCGERTYIPKRCANAFNEFQEFVTTNIESNNG